MGPPTMSASSVTTVKSAVTTTHEHAVTPDKTPTVAECAGLSPSDWRHRHGGPKRSEGEAGAGQADYRKRPTARSAERVANEW